MQKDREKQNSGTKRLYLGSRPESIDPRRTTRPASQGLLRQRHTNITDPWSPTPCMVTHECEFGPVRVGNRCSWPGPTRSNHRSFWLRLLGTKQSRRGVDPWSPASEALLALRRSLPWSPQQPRPARESGARFRSTARD